MKRTQWIALVALLPFAVGSVAGGALGQDKAKPPAKNAKGTVATPAAEAAPADNCRDQIVAMRRAGEAPSAATTGNATTIDKTSAPTAASEQEAAYAAYDQGKYLTALELAHASAVRGDPQAHTLVARIYAEGQGVAKDEMTAARWYARAAELCDVPALFAYGVMLAEGRIISKDRVQAGDMLEKAALSGHALANYNLGLLFLRGDGKPENPYRAAQHILYAAERGVAAAQYDMGTLHLTGTGVANDALEASRWLGRAAAGGHTAAQFDYAILLLRGLGLNQDVPFAVDYLRAAAEKGIGGAQNRLAHLHLEGVRVDKSPVEAAKWRLIAKASGLADDGLDAQVAKLSKADLAAAEKLANAWREARAITGGTGITPEPKL